MLSSRTFVARSVQRCLQSPPVPLSTTTYSQHHFFSSAAAAEESSSPPRRRTILQDKDPITVTPAACERLATLLASQPDAAGIRLGVKRRGCNGLSYTLNYVKDLHTAPKVSLQTHNGIRIFVEPMALFNVVGTEMDWQESTMASEFVFHNPNAKGECGCGESFNV